jgi:hypothetical protein
MFSTLKKFGGSAFSGRVLIEENDRMIEEDRLTSDARKHSLVIPVIFSDKAGFDGIKTWQKLAPEFIGKDAPFAESFPNLKEVTRNYAGQEFSSIRKQLEEERERAGESFEAVGLKLPAGETTRWGLLLIFVVQLYLWIHIRELQRKLSPQDEALNFPWIGLYAGTAAKIVFYLSIALVPVIAVLTVGHAADMFKRPVGWVTARSLNIAFTSGAALVSSGLSMLTIIAHRRIWLCVAREEVNAC